MTERREANRQTLLVIGASGDLTSRLLLPGLASLLGARRRRRAGSVADRHRPERLE